MNDIHQIPRLETTELIEEWNEEEKIPIKNSTSSKKDGDKDGDDKPAAKQEFEVKQRKKTASYPLQFDTQAHALPPTVRQQYRKLETDLMTQDRKFLDLKESKNDLETLCYEMRNNCGE